MSERRCVSIKILKLIGEVLAKHIELLESELKQIKMTQDMNAWYTKVGKRIEDISNMYPATYEDAAIIFEEWCKGVLSECIPDHETLRRYAAYTANKDNFIQWRMNEKRF